MDQEQAKAYFLSIYEKHADEIFRFCFMKVSNKEKAEDLTQDAFMRYWHSLRTGEPIRNDRAFLYTLARNLVIDWYRKKKESSLDVIQEAGIDFAGEGRADVEIAAQMKAFREGKRPATVMPQLAKGYTDAQIDAIAGWFAAQKR